MMCKPSLCGVVLAAGASSRMGTDKALLPWPPAAQSAVASGSNTLLSAAIRALKPFTQSVIVVAGANAGRLADIVESCCAELVQNPAPERGQFSSLQVGLRQVLAGGCNTAIITLVDCPPLCMASLQKLNSAFEDALSAGQWGVAPENNGKHGHPLFAGRNLIDAFLASPVTSNAREVKRANARHIGYISVPDSLVSLDVNTPEEYKALVATFHHSG